MRHCQRVRRVAAQALAQFVDQCIPVAPGLGKWRLPHGQARGIEPLAVLHLHSTRLDFKDDQAMVGVEYHQVCLAD